MQGSSLVASQFGQTPTSGSVNQNFGMIGSNLFQLPAWAKEANVTMLPETSSPDASGRIKKKHLVICKTNIFNQKRKIPSSDIAFRFIFA